MRRRDPEELSVTLLAKREHDLGRVEFSDDDVPAIQKLREHYQALAGVPLNFKAEYKPEYDRSIIEAALQGIPPRVWAARVLVPVYRLRSWVKLHPSFCDALAVAGQVIEDYYLAQATDLVQKEKGFSSSNAKMFAMIVENVVGWGTKAVSEPLSATVVMETGQKREMTSDEKKQRLGELLSLAQDRTAEQSSTRTGI